MATTYERLHCFGGQAARHDAQALYRPGGGMPSPLRRHRHVRTAAVVVSRTADVASLIRNPGSRASTRMVLLPAPINRGRDTAKPVPPACR